LPRKFLLRALAASVLACLLPFEIVLVGPTCSSWTGASSSLKGLKMSKMRGGEAGEGYIGFLWENVKFSANAGRPKSFQGRNQSFHLEMLL